MALQLVEQMDTYKPVTQLSSRARDKTKTRQTNSWRRRMANGWTKERRAQQAELIRRWKPWEQSTGPKTPEGKSRVARNAYRGGVRPLMRELARAMKGHRQMLEGGYLTQTPLI
jgi:hypothetical protein